MGSDADEHHADESPLSMTWSVGRIAAVVAMLAIIGFWAWVFSGAPAKANPDYLDDRDYAAALEARCQELRDDIAELPSATELPDRTERAAVLDQANALVAGFIDDVAAEAPTEARPPRRSTDGSATGGPTSAIASGTSSGCAPTRATGST
ncbi:MAG: hypothetical protein R2702_02315 [Acidimicrobiales bacterium]